jgi:hypothetical protein
MHMKIKPFTRLAAVLAVLVSMSAAAEQVGGPIGPVVGRDPPPGPTYTARTYYKIVIIPGTQANNWTPTYVNSSISSTTSDPACAGAFASHQAYIASHGYIYANYRTCN